MRLAQFSDLHLRWHQPGTSRSVKRRCRLMPALFEQAVSQAVAAGAQVLLVTGDLLDVPGYLLDGDDYYDYQRPLWDAAVLADYELLRQILQRSGVPYLVLPGNHDDHRALARIFPPQPVVDLGGYRFVSFWDRDAQANVPRRLDRERVLLEQVLAAADSPPQVHLQHFVVTPALNEGWPHTYFEGEHLVQQIVGSNKVVLSLSGHYHPGTERIDLGDTCFTTAPAFGEFPHRYRLYDLRRQEVAPQTVALLPEPTEAGRRLLGLDRDGVLNVAPSWRSGPELLQPIPGAGRALRRLHEAGWASVVLSSQSAVGAGYVTSSVVDSVFDRLAWFLQQEGACFDAFCYSTGAGERAVHPSLEPTENAKPNPQLLLDAASELHLESAGGCYIGDTLGDLETAVLAGLQPILVRSGHGAASEARLAQRPDLAGTAVVDDLPAAADWLLAQR
ncbi:MAG: HAD-IIIA family hydrolase [Fimbriimonadaceae bacterium]|nr:HAD-IIIA family hydrolase [Fimbriimonadaceae bacterium]